MDYTYVHLGWQAGRVRLWVKVDPGGSFVGRLMDATQYHNFVEGQEATFIEFQQLTSVLTEISLPHPGDWYVVMEGAGTYEVIVPPHPLLICICPPSAGLNDTKTSIPAVLNCTREPPGNPITRPSLHLEATADPRLLACRRRRANTK